MQAKTPGFGRTRLLAAGLVVVGVVAVVCCLAATAGHLSGRVVLKDALDSEVDNLEMLDAGGFSQAGASPGRWHHINPKQLDTQRFLSRMSNENQLMPFKGMPPQEQTTYSPIDHVLAHGSGWLSSDGERFPLMQEAKRVLPNYDSDYRAKGGVDWNSIGASGFAAPHPYMSQPAAVWEAHEAMRGTLGSFENKPVPEFEAGDRSYLGAAQQAQQAHAQEEPFSKITFSRRDLPARMPAKSQVKYSYWPSRMTPDDAAATYAEIRGKRAEAGYATDEYAAAWRQWYNWQQQQQDQQQQHVKNANKHLANAYYHQTNAAGSSGQARYGGQETADAIYAYIAAHKGSETGSGSTAAIIAQYMRSIAQAAKRNQEAEAQAARMAAEAKHTVEPEESAAEPVEQEATNEEESGESTADHVRQARIRRAEEEAAAAEAAAFEEQTEKALKPLREQIDAMEAKIAAAAGTATESRGGGSASSKSAAGVRGLSFSVPGAIKIDHLELPGGQYSLQLGGDTLIRAHDAASAAGAAPPLASSAHEHEEKEARGEEEEDTEDDVLDKAKDLHVDLDHAAVQAAAKELQSKYIDDAEAVGEQDEEAKEQDDVLDKAKDMHVDLNQAAVEAAAKELREQYVGAASEQPLDKEEDDVLNSAGDTDNGVDAMAAKALANALKKSTVLNAGANKEHEESAEGDDVLDTAKNAVVEVDTPRMSAAVAKIKAQVLQNGVGGGVAGGGAAADDDDVLDTAKMTDAGVNRAAEKEAAAGLVQRTLQQHAHATDATDATEDEVDAETVKEEAALAGAEQAIKREMVPIVRVKKARSLRKEIERKLHQATALEVTGAHHYIDDDLVGRVVRPSFGLIAPQHKAGEEHYVDDDSQGRVGYSKPTAIKAHSKRSSARTAGTARKAGAAMKQARLQILSETMLMPVPMDVDPEDAYLDPEGGSHHDMEMESMYGSHDMSDVDKQNQLELRDSEDEDAKQPDQLRPTNFAGGLGTRGEMRGASAWYAEWWEHPNLQDISEETQEMLGLTSDISGEPQGTDEGKRKLIMEGLNVNGWEPGRDTDQIRQDHLDHEQVSPGFWNDDLTPAVEPDTDLHHPCGSPLRKRPCTGGESKPPAGGEAVANSPSRNSGTGNAHIPVSVDPVTRMPKGDIWVDPMPLEKLCKGHENATWCQEDAN